MSLLEHGKKDTRVRALVLRIKHLSLVSDTVLEAEKDASALRLVLSLVERNAPSTWPCWELLRELIFQAGSRE